MVFILYTRLPVGKQRDDGRFDVFISQNAQTYRYLINNRNFESFVNVVKVDAESGKSISYAGAGFKIYDPQGNQSK